MHRYEISNYARIGFESAHNQTYWTCEPYIGAGCAGLLFLFIGIRLAQTEWKGLDWIRQLGMYSYWIFALHSIEMEALPWSHWLQPLAAWPAAALLLEGYLTRRRLEGAK